MKTTKASWLQEVRQSHTARVYGRDNWSKRRNKLLHGANPGYWVAKIERNMGRDREITERLKKDGWSVLRLWESEVQRELDRVVASVIYAVRRGSA